MKPDIATPLLEVGLDLPSRVDVPADQNTVRRLVGKLQVWSRDLPFGLFDDRLVGGQGAEPKPVEVGPELGEAVGVQAVDATVTGGLVDDQPRFLQDLEVLRDGGPADGQAAGELPDRARAIGKPLEG